MIYSNDKQFWIPAFAGMTLRGFIVSPIECHSRVGGNPENKILNRNLGHIYIKIYPFHLILSIIILSSNIFNVKDFKLFNTLGNIYGYLISHASAY